ncbi:MAG: hypothetical protein ACPF9D_01850, partial [Owenweeksia sp.]
MMLPNLIIGGAPKCGTSSMYFWLADHPEVCASRVKEPFYFVNEKNRFNAGLNMNEHSLEEYSGLFSHCSSDAKYCFEATAQYLYFDSALESFKQLPEPPVVI